MLRGFPFARNAADITGASQRMEEISSDVVPDSWKKPNTNAWIFSKGSRTDCDTKYRLADCLTGNRCGKTVKAFTPLIRRSYHKYILRCYVGTKLYINFSLKSQGIPFSQHNEFLLTKRMMVPGISWRRNKNERKSTCLHQIIRQDKAYTWIFTHIHASCPS